MAIARKNDKLVLKLTALTVVGIALASTEAWSASSMRASSTSRSAPQRSMYTMKAKSVAMNTPAASLKTKATTAAAAPKKALSGSLNISPARTLVDFQDGSKNESVDTTLVNNYQLNDNYKIYNKIIYSADLKNSARNDFADPELNVIRSAYSLGKTFTMSPAILGSLPLSKTSRLDTKFYGGLGASLKWGLASGTLPTGFNVTLTTALSRLFYEASTAVSGKVLNQYSAYQKLVVNYSVDKHSFTLVGNHVNAMTFQGSLKESFVLAEEYEFSANERWSFILGHANAGAALKANGSDSNIQFINDNSSVVYAGVTFKY